jgi:hypothetical protein
MASTVTAIITEFRSLFYTDCSEATAQTLFNEAYKHVLMNIKCRTAEVILTVTAGTREYTLAEVNQQVNFAYWEPSTDLASSWQLQECNLDSLSIVEPGWQSSGGSTSQPTRYYTTNVSNSDGAIIKIGLDPIPSTTSSGGYPRVRLNVTQYSTLTASETVPEGLLDDNVYLFYMAWRWAIRQDREQMNMWKDAYRESLAENQVFFQKRLVLDGRAQVISPVVNMQGNII